MQIIQVIFVNTSCTTFDLLIVLRFILSLTLADFSLSVLVMTPYVLNHKHWAWGATLCKIWGTADVLLTSASVYSVVGISIDRFFAVFFPIRYVTINLPEIKQDHKSIYMAFTDPSISLLSRVQYFQLFPE
jgi:hypothetical protein